MNNNSKGLSIAALVCGILGIIGSFIPIVCYVTFILAILGIVFGVKARKTALPGETDGPCYGWLGAGHHRNRIWRVGCDLCHLRAGCGWRSRRSGRTGITDI